jgi:hypothetical protein
LKAAFELGVHGPVFFAHASNMLTQVGSLAHASVAEQQARARHAPQAVDPAAGAQVAAGEHLPTQSATMPLPMQATCFEPQVVTLEQSSTSFQHVGSPPAESVQIQDAVDGHRPPSW